MLPTKAERILSRYRPIAPKPVPIPPSASFNGTADPSSTCASLDSFANSSSKCKRSRKRKAEESSASGKSGKAPKPIASGFSNNGGVSSVTHGLSDGTVPLGDLRSAGQIPHSGRAYGMERGVEMSNWTTRDTRALSEATLTSYGVAQLCVAGGSTMMQHQGSSMAELANAHHYQHFSPLHQRLDTAYNPSGSPLVQKDVGFMERAAAASYVGGFTEMIRGITRLPSAADVQSLMQARPCPPPVIGQSAPCPPPVIGQSAPCANSTGARNLPTHQVQPRRPEQVPLRASLPQNIMAKPASLNQVDQVCPSNGTLVTLPLLPPAPLRMGASPEATIRTDSSSAEQLIQESQHSSWAYQTARGCEPSVVLSCCSPSHVQTGAIAPSGTSAFSPLKTTMEVGSCMSSLHSIPLTSGAVIDEVYLEQVYGGSADPVLLVDDCNQVLWFNKPYDRFLKSAAERMSGKVVPTGPYIDPLGHPTPLGSFVLPVYGKPAKLRNATLWGFLKKLVVQDQRPPLERCPSGSSSQLHLSIGESCQTRPQACVEVAARVSEAVNVGHWRPVTVTLDSVTELHMEAPGAAESVEAVEARLGAGTEPALITDHLNRVSWVSTALKEMVGHTKVERSIAHAGIPGNHLSEGSRSGAAEFIICCAERVPHSAWAFSGRVNLEWMKGSKRRSITVPCDVSRLASSSRSLDMNWIWKFDMAVSLCLNSPC